MFQLKQTSAALLLAAATTASAGTIYSNDFDGNEVLGTGITTSGFTTTATEVAATGYAPDWSGNYLVNRSKGNPATPSSITLNNLGLHSEVSFGFSLGLLESWDGPNKWGPDSLDFYVDGGWVGSILHSHSTNTTGTSYPTGITFLAQNAEINSNMGWSDTLIDMTGAGFLTGLAHSASSLTLSIVASGVNWQGGNDEAWGIDNFAVSYDGQQGVITDISAVPLPAAAWLFLTALGGLAGFSRFKKQA